MFKSITALLLLTIPLAGFSKQQDILLYGQSNLSSNNFGVYQFTSGCDNNMQSISESLAEPNCGSVCNGMRLYTFSAEEGEYGTEFAVYVYDITDKFSLITRIGSAYSIAIPQQVLAYDATTETIYTAFQESNYYGEYETFIGTINLSDRTISKIGNSLYFGYGSTSIVALSFNPQGELYAIASNSNLYKVDKTNGNLTNIGSTGIYTEFEQSMTFSPDGNEIYWAMCNSDEKALYKVDPLNASVSKIKDFPAGESFITLWTGNSVISDGAPAAPTNIYTSFKNGALTGKISFTAPTLTHNGKDLTGDLNYEVKANDTILATGITTPGETTECEVTLESNGLTDFTVTLSNEEGVGDNATLKDIYIGIDTPKNVENLLLTNDESNNTFTITWDSPTEGIHGGYIDANAIKYSIRRLPELTEISSNATSPFVDTFTSETPVKCAYEVTPYINETLKGLPLTTNYIMVGNAFEPPYNETFDTASDANLWTVCDINNNGNSWEYMWDYGYYRIYNNTSAKDDWLISPYIALYPDNVYNLSFDIRTIANEEFEVKTGLSMNPEDLNITLMQSEIVPDSNYDWINRTCSFSVPQKGKYHIGIHSTTKNINEGLALYIDNIKLIVEKVSGIEGIDADSNEGVAKYYNMQGLKVDEEALTPGIYIRRTATSTEKIVVR